MQIKNFFIHFKVSSRKDVYDKKVQMEDRKETYMKTLYLHVGTPKTATSSIQKFLAQNRKVLEAHGYCYPRSQHKYPGINPRRNAHFLFGRVINENGERSKKNEALYYEEGMQQVRTAFQTYDHVILSDESIWYCLSYFKKSLLTKLKEEADRESFEIKVIVYLRRQDAFLLSRWNQAVKQNTTFAAALSCEDYFAVEQQKEEKLYAYADKLDEIAKVIGKENLIVRRFEPGSWRDGLIIHDFMHEIGLDVSEDFQPLEQEANLRLGKNATEIKRVINANGDFTAEEISYFGKFLKEISNNGSQEAPSAMLEKTEMQQFLKKYETQNERVAEEYIGDGKPLFSAEIKDLPKWSANNSAMQEDMIRFFTEVMTDLRRENETQQKEIEKLHKQVDKLTADFALFKDKVRHPFRTIINRLFHRKQQKKS